MDCHRDLIVSLLRPLAVGPYNRGLIHLVDRNNELGDSKCLGQLGVLPCLTTTLKPCLKLALSTQQEAHRQNTVGLHRLSLLDIVNPNF